MIRVTFLLLTFVYVGISCNNDDDNNEIPIEEQNIQDDGSIQVFLEDYYFDETGKVTAFDSEDPDDDEETPLKDIAVGINNGVYYAINPNVTAEGESVTNVDTQEILLHYNLALFSSGKTGDEYTITSYISHPVSTLNSGGLPTWNTPFYQYTLTDDDINRNRTLDYYEMEGFREAIGHFRATNNNLADNTVFQGVIIVPSRANYARDANYLNLRNQVAVINFELYDIRND